MKPQRKSRWPLSCLVVATIGLLSGGCVAFPDDLHDVQQTFTHPTKHLIRNVPARPLPTPSSPSPELLS